jgi:hypothetical protein
MAKARHDTGDRDRGCGPVDRKEPNAVVAGRSIAVAVQRIQAKKVDHPVGGTVSMSLIEKAQRPARHEAVGKDAVATIVLDRQVVEACVVGVAFDGNPVQRMGLHCIVGGRAIRTPLPDAHADLGTEMAVGV